MLNIFKKEQSYAKVIGTGIVSGAAEALYCFVIAGFITSIGERNIEKNPFVGFSFMLILFVMSAAISGLLVFGYPTYLAFKKDFKSAVLASVSSVATIVVIALIFIAIVLLP